MLDRQIGSTATTTTSAQDPGVGVKRRMFAGFRPLSGFGLLRMRSSQNRSISLPESKFLYIFLSFVSLSNKIFTFCFVTWTFDFVTI